MSNKIATPTVGRGFTIANLLPERPATSPENPSDGSANLLGADLCKDENEGQGRIRSRSADPASLLLGDYMMAPWVAWWERMRTEPQSPATRKSGICGGGSGNSSGNGGYGVREEEGPTTVWAQFTACAPGRGSRASRHRRSNEYVSGKKLLLFLLLFTVTLFTHFTLT